MVGQSIQKVAETAAAWFQTAERTNGDLFDRLRDGAPQWVTDAIQAAHDGGEILPDDWTYGIVRRVFGVLAETDESDLEGLRDEFADDIDVYHGERIAWLATYPRAVEACDDAVSELGPQDPANIIATIGQGQYVVRGRIFDVVCGACEAQVSES